MKLIVEKSRYLALIGVIGLLVAAIAAFGWGFFKTCLLVYEVTIGASASTSVIVDLVKIVDFFLIATILLIFAASLYELFIAEINVPDWMIVHNLYELKSKLKQHDCSCSGGKISGGSLPYQGCLRPDADWHCHRRHLGGADRLQLFRQKGLAASLARQ